MAIKGLIFDLDGVITDTARLHFLAWQKVLKDEGLEYSEAENDLLKGLPRRDTLVAILKQKQIKWDDKKIDDVCDKKNKIYVASLDKELGKDDILPGISELLKQAKEMKLRMAIASSSKNAPNIIKKLGIADYFEYIVDPSKIKKGKPAPDIYIAAAEGLNLLPEECIGFEDAYLGVVGLLAANINTVSITNGIREMYVYGTYIADDTKELNLQKIMYYFLGAEKVSYEAILHTAFGRYAYQNSTGDTLTVFLRTKKDNISYVDVIVGDPFNWKQKNDVAGGVTQLGGGDSMYWEEEGKIRMSKYMSDTYFDYYKAKIKTKSKRVRYAFDIIGVDGTEFLYGEKGFFPPEADIANFGFTWGYLNEGNISNIPKWVASTIWYQIFPERFWNGDKSNDNEGTLAWGSAEPKPDNYFGGDLQGVIDKLDHLVELGVTGIYFTPIFHANTNHKYDTEDYLEIDPHFGDEAKFKELIDKCHAKGIKVMVDAVFNHCGAKFKPWLDVVKNKEKSKYKDWFFINDFSDLRPAKDYPCGYFRDTNYVYETFAYEPSMPRLNWNNPDVKAYFKNVVQKWTKLGIDAWRLDVANEPPLNFWRSFRKWAKEINPEIYILGEVWYNSSLYLNGDTFDGVMNYTLRDCLLTSIKNDWPASKTKQELAKYLLIYTNPIKRGMFNLLGSHDTPRILTEFGENVDKYLLAYRLLFHMLGSVCIYYGDEIGMTGAHDPGCRKCMEWDKSKWNTEIYNTFKNLIKMRKSNKLLVNNEFNFIDGDNVKELFKKQANDKCLTFKLYRKEDVVYCIANLTNKPQKVSLANKKWFDIYLEKDVPCELEIKPYDMYTLKVKEGK